MIYLYLNNEYGSSNATSDKGLNEVPTAFKNFTSANLRRVEWETIGIYHSVYIPYHERENAKEFLLKYDIEVEIVEEHEFNKICKALNSSLIPTNETIIRESVTEYLNNKYDIAHIQDEYTHAMLPVRADLFAVTNDKAVITVEIKSDRDTFTRLKKQLEEYTKFSHIVYVAIDVCHLVKFKKGFPNYHGGILVYEDGELHIHSASHRSKSIECSRLLWKQELQSFLCFKGSFSKYAIDRLEYFIENIFTVREHKAIAEFLFVNRYLKQKNDFKHLINDYDYKQALINKLVKDKKCQSR